MKNEKILPFTPLAELHTHTEHVPTVERVKLRILVNRLITNLVQYTPNAVEALAPTTNKEAAATYLAEVLSTLQAYLARLDDSSKPLKNIPARYIQVIGIAQNIERLLEYRGIELQHQVLPFPEPDTD